MSLKISKKKSVYFMKGRITKSTVNLFLIYFKKKLFKKEKIVLNIDAIKQIDRIGLKALKEFKTVARKYLIKSTKTTRNYLC